MLMVMTLCSPPYSTSARASAVSVLPTPLVPASMNTPMGFDGLSSPARLVWMRLAIIFIAWSWPITRFARCWSRFSTVSISSLSIRPTGIPVQSPTTVATACASTMGRISGVSPCIAVRSALRVFSCTIRVARSSGVSGLVAAASEPGAASTLVPPSRSLARSAMMSSTTAFSASHRTVSPSSRFSSSALIAVMAVRRSPTS